MNEIANPGAAKPSLTGTICLAAASSNRHYDLHPSRLGIGPAGVTNFVLPIGDNEADEFCDLFAARLAEALRARNIDHDRVAEALWLVLISIVFEGATLFRLTRLSRRFRELGFLASWGGRASALEQISQGEIPESPILRALLVGPSPGRFNSPWVRWLASLGRRDGFSRRPPQFLDPARDALCLVGGPAPKAIAEVEEKRLVLSRFEYWIDLATGWQERMPELADRDATQEMIEIAEKTFADFDEVMPSHVRTSLSSSVNALARLALKSLNDVESRARNLPRTFLTGSTGQLQNRAIGRVIQKEGGTVTIIDHGVGGGWRQIPSLTITFWDFPNRYITYTETQAQGIRDLIEPRFKVGDVECEPTASPVRLLPPRVASRRKQRSSDGCNLRVMYVPTIYIGERYYAPGLPTDIAEIDFQARLMSHMKSRGYEVTIKPHPECKIGIRPDLAALGDGMMETRNFELVIEDADLLLFDCPSSTTFRTAVCSDLPIVLLEHGRVPITDHALTFIKKRVAVAMTRRDETNRIEFDWSELDLAIETAPDLRDPTFANLYFGADI